MSFMFPFLICKKHLSTTNVADKSDSKRQSFFNVRNKRSGSTADPDKEIPRECKRQNSKAANRQIF